MSFDNKPAAYWVRMGEIGELIASDVFSHIMHERYGRVQRIVNGHEELYKTPAELYPIDNFDEEAHHLDLVAADMRPNLAFWVYGIAEVKSTYSRKKSEFELNGMCPHYLSMAVRCNIPVYLLVVRFPRPLPDDILTDEGSVRAFMEFKDIAGVEVYPPGTHTMTDKTISIGAPKKSEPLSPIKDPPTGQPVLSDDELCKKLIEEANRYDG
jgi:hypothetical protein